MARTRLVNGKRVPLTDEENIARDVQEAAQAARVRTKKPTHIEILHDALMTKGTLVQADIDAAKSKLMK